MIINADYEHDCWQLKFSIFVLNAFYIKIHLELYSILEKLTKQKPDLRNSSCRCIKLLLHWFHALLNNVSCLFFSRIFCKTNILNRRDGILFQLLNVKFSSQYSNLMKAISEKNLHMEYPKFFYQIIISETHFFLEYCQVNPVYC